METITFNIIPFPDGGYFALSIGESIFTQAETLDQLGKNIVEAIDCHFEQCRRPKKVIITLSFELN